MVIAVGFRTTPNNVFYSIIEEIEEQVVIKILDNLVVPNALDIPEKLKFLRSTFLDILTEFNVSVGCIRIAESNSDNISTERIYIEAVLQELIASSTLEKYYVGQISNISSKLSMERTDFKEYAEGRKVFHEIDGWERFKKEERESLIAAFSALTL